MLHVRPPQALSTAGDLGSALAWPGAAEDVAAEPLPNAPPGRRLPPREAGAARDAAQEVAAALVRGSIGFLASCALLVACMIGLAAL